MLLKNLDSITTKTMKNKYTLKTNPGTLLQHHFKSKKKKLTEFEHELKSRHKKLLPKYNKINLSNLNPVQATALKQLKADTDFIIKPTDKNLGPVIMDTISYTQQVLKEHLLTSTYKQLTETEAKYKMESIKATTHNFK